MEMFGGETEESMNKCSLKTHELIKCTLKINKLDLNKYIANLNKK